MDHVQIAIEVTDNDDVDARAVISSGLRAFNEKKAGALAYEPLNVLLRNHRGSVVGGLWGETYWQSLYVELLYVPAELRGRDLGTQLIREAEETARTRGCTKAWLDTFSFQAPGFYERLGYTRFGVLADFPKGHDRHFFSKPL